MKKPVFMAIALLCCAAPLALADLVDETKSPIGYGTKGYVWNRVTAERAEVLKLAGDVTRGEQAFRGCRGCHKPDAVGLIDGTYPRLAGQHASVVIKQVFDTRAGLRVNPKMDPFSDDHALSNQELADVAVYLSGLESTRENGKGSGDFVARGKALYEKNNCAKCHGPNGEGNAEKTYPAIAAQHFRYLNREIREIKQGTRGNAHPDMVKIVKNMSHDDIEAIADYLSRLPDYRQKAK